MSWDRSYSLLEGTQGWCIRATPTCRRQAPRVQRTSQQGFHARHITLHQLVHRLRGRYLFARAPSA